MKIFPEIYSSEWLDPDGDWTAQDLISFDTAAVPRRPEGDGPYRFRRWCPARRYATVTVVDARGWAVDHAGNAHDAAPRGERARDGIDGPVGGLVEPSVAIVRALGLRFGAVIVGVPRQRRARGSDASTPTPRRGDGTPPGHHRRCARWRRWSRDRPADSL